jgi:hypothetical protein
MTDIEDVIEQGKRNAYAIELIKRHCAHARVEPSRLHGHSMVEDMTGLPISVREMRCAHAPAPTGVGWDLLSTAIGFYEANCAGCPHRQVQGLPNLKTTAEGVLEERRRHRDEEERRAKSAQEARVARAADRTLRVADDPADTREMVRLLDGIDAEIVDGRAEEFVDLCQLHPEACTPAAADVLLEIAATCPCDPLFAALGHLDRAGKLDRTRLLGVAVDGLSRLPMNYAAEIVVELQHGLTAGQLRSAFGSIARLAAPLNDFGTPPKPDIGSLRVAAAHDLPALLDTLQAMIGSPEQYEHRVGAGAAARLIEIEPSVSMVFVAPLIDALTQPGSLEHFVGSPLGEITDGLGAALLADPEGAITVLEQRAPLVGEDVRSALFRVLGGAIKHRGHGGEGAATVAEHAIDAAFQRLSSDWGANVAFDSAALIKLTVQERPDLMTSRVDQVFGALMTHTATPAETKSALDASSTTPPGLQALEAMNRRSTRAAIIRELREALGQLVPHAPAAVARNVTTIIDAPDPRSEEALELRDEAVRLLGDLGKRPDMLNEVVPMLWTALLHSEQRVRARAVEAWARIARAHGEVLPTDLSDLLPSLLADEYVVVHTAVIRALREGLPVSDATFRPIVKSLFGWANTYASRDPKTLDEILSSLWRLSCRIPDGPGSALREQCMQFAAYLDRYDKARFVQWQARGDEALASYLPRLLEVLAEDRNGIADRRDEELLRRLRALTSEQLASNVDAIADTARAHLPGDPWKAQRFVEVLQRAGCWSEALELSKEILASIPDTTEEAIKRDGIRSVTELARAEHALLEHRNSDASTALSSAVEADQRAREAWKAQPSPWHEA